MAGRSASSCATRTRPAHRRPAWTRPLLPGLTSLATYRWFADRVDQVRRALLAFLDECRQEGRIVVAYGAPSRGNTLVNSAGTTGADVAFAADRSPEEQGSYLPGSRIPIFGPGRVAEVRPDFLLILTWDLRERGRCADGDLMSDDDRARLAGEIEARSSGLDILVHCVGTRANVADATVAEFDRQYAANVRAPFALTQALLPSLRRARGQIVVNSTAGLVARANASQFAATQHATRAFADALRDVKSTETGSGSLRSTPDRHTAPGAHPRVGGQAISPRRLASAGEHCGHGRGGRRPPANRRGHGADDPFDGQDLTHA